jgi:predicted histidine transporter YuiF (NhaC family)
LLLLYEGRRQIERRYKACLLGRLLQVLGLCKSCALLFQNFVDIFKGILWRNFEKRYLNLSVHEVPFYLVFVVFCTDIQTLAAKEQSHVSHSLFTVT